MYSIRVILIIKLAWNKNQFLKMKTIYCVLLATSVLAMSSCKKDELVVEAPIVSKYKTLNGNAPLVIGHRGASGLKPEHTIESYTLAIDQGADFIEPDLVLTKDSVLICRHEPMLSGTTNVAELSEFAAKKTSKMVDGVEYKNEWFASDFTLSEIKKLRAKQAFADRPQGDNGKFAIPTFEEVADLAKSQSALKGRTIGIYPETKHPTFHNTLKLPIDDKLIEMLNKKGWNNGSSPVFVQSFEVANLQYIRSKSTVKIVQLFDADDVAKDGKMVMLAPYAQPYDFVESKDPRTYNDLATDAGLDFIKSYANGIGPWKPFIQPYTFTDANSDGKADDINLDGMVNDADRTKLPATDLIERAHKRGLVVHAYTFRDEAKRLLNDYKNDPKAEYKHFYDLGIDGVFSDFPATAVSAK